MSQSESAQSASTNRAAEDDSQAATDDQTDQQPVGVALIDEAGFKTLLEDYQGQVLLIDFWATWCVSCLKQFPHTVKLYEKFADRGLSVVTISLDDPEKKAEVHEFLRKQDATTDNYISQYGGSDKSMQVFGIESGLPHYKVYDRQGKLHRTFATGQENIDLEELDQAVEELVGP